MKPENPFRDWLQSDLYDGTWVPVAGLGGWLRPVSLPVLFPSGQCEPLLSSTDWPFEMTAAQPEVWGFKEVTEAKLHPEHYRGEIPVEPLIASFDPPGRRRWLEPVQSFVLFHAAAPRHQPGGRIGWEVSDEDGKPEEIARWSPVDDEVGVLEIRRDILFDFMQTFDFDLAVFFEENRPTEAVPEGWSDEAHELLRTWRVWAARPLDAIRVVLRCVTVIPKPPPTSEEDDPIGKTLDYPIGTDPVTGKPVRVSYPGPPNGRTTWAGAGNDNFLTPVYFRRQVLDHYLSEPRYYTVSDTQVEAGHMWSIPIAITERGHVQTWLGDLGRISQTAQRHWQHYAITDDDEVPDWRIKRDLHVEWIGPPRDEGIDRVKVGVERCNQAALSYCGVPLFTPVEGFNAQRIAALHKPLNDSQPEFQHQVTSLAILIVDHLNVEFLQAVGAGGKGRPLNRLATWISSTFSMTPEDAKDSIGGIYAVYAIRSKVATHRAGSSGAEALERAGIDLDDLPAGFESLAQGIAESLDELCCHINALTPLD
jgi:hypothetical protein